MINFLLAYYYSLCSKMSKTSGKNVEEHIIVEEVVEGGEVEEQTEDETVKRSMKKRKGRGDLIFGLGSLYKDSTYRNKWQTQGNVQLFYSIVQSFKLC